jgi:mRNA-degrading endonuclease RelE of RelBE toxin-antitoxin system
LPEHLVFVERKAQNNSKNCPQDAQNRINNALHILQDEDLSLKLDIKKLQGYPKHYRIRVGKHTILFELSIDKTIVVYAILPRGTAYK